MQLDKTKGYIFRVSDVEQAKGVVRILVQQGFHTPTPITLERIVIAGNIWVIPDCLFLNYDCNIKHNRGIWVDTEMFLEYSTPTKVKETIQVGDTIFDKEEFELVVSKLKGVKV
jgi:hypothetical protein